MDRFTVVGLCVALAVTACLEGTEMPGAAVSRATVRSADGMKIAYVSAGRGDVALLFLHGGFADSSFWDGQLAAFSDRYRVVAMDLAGHGASGRERPVWTVAGLGGDVRAVVEALGLERVVVIGNSLGGPVALEAARVMPDRVAAVIGVDTFQDAKATPGDEQWDAYVDAWRRDYRGTCAEMVNALFHADADPVLKEDVRRRMCDTEPRVPLGVLQAFRGYDMGKAMRAVSVPVRSINGDLHPTDVEGNRAFADFDAVVMEHTGHYPMLEKPAEFNRLLDRMLTELGLGPSPEAHPGR